MSQPMNRRVERLSFEGSAGDRLDARLDLPIGPPKAFALFAHCFTCSKESPAATQITRGLVRLGIGVLRFDFTGLGGSDGDFANTNFSSNVADLVRAADTLRARGAAPRILIGHSLGGAAVLAAAARIPEAVAVVTIGAPFDLTAVTRLIPSEAVSELARSGEAIVDFGGRPFPVRRQFLADVSSQNLTGAIAGLHRALLVFHSPRDELVAVENARRIFDIAKHPKSFVSLDDADHLLTRRADGAYVAEVVGAWVRRYLNEEAVSDDAIASEGMVVVGGAPGGKLAQEIRAGRHMLVADEPSPLGDGIGPTPYDLLLASLGACTAMTVRLYAARKGWPLETLGVRLAHARVYAADARDSEAGRSMIDGIDVQLDVSGPLTEEQRERLLEIAQRCPVHRTLVSDKQIVTRFAPKTEPHALAASRSASVA